MSAAGQLRAKCASGAVVRSMPVTKSPRGEGALQTHSRQDPAVHRTKAVEHGEQAILCSVDKGMQ